MIDAVNVDQEIGGRGLLKSLEFSQRRTGVRKRPLQLHGRTVHIVAFGLASLKSS
jgi:hypothetical protein